jgi:hypothetical protein
MFHEEALGEATPALAGEAMAEARGVEKAYAAGDVRVHALRGVGHRHSPAAQTLRNTLSSPVYLPTADCG